MKIPDKFAEFDRIFSTRKPVIGMVHLAPLPGSPRYDPMSMEEITDLALDDAHKLKSAGCNRVE